MVKGELERRSNVIRLALIEGVQFLAGSWFIQVYVDVTFNLVVFPVLLENFYLFYVFELQVDKIYGAGILCPQNVLLGFAL